MFELPSIPNLIVSTIVFILAMRYSNRIFDLWVAPKGMIRSLSVFMLAYVLSWGAGELTDKVLGTAVQPATDFAQLVKAVGQ
jgi:hypothetical protein